MKELLLGIVLFFGMHLISVVALPLRNSLAGKSELGWKALYSIISLIGIVMITRGYAEMRSAATLLYVSPGWLRHVSALLLMPTFVLFLAPYFPGRIKNTLKHPQLIAVMIWAVAHLLVNGTLGDVLLFGSFLVWAGADRLSMISRETRPVPAAPASPHNDLIVVVIGLAVYVAFVFWLHELAFGISPIAGV